MHLDLAARKSTQQNKGKKESLFSFLSFAMKPSHVNKKFYYRFTYHKMLHGAYQKLKKPLEYVLSFSVKASLKMGGQEFMRLGHFQKNHLNSKSLIFDKFSLVKRQACI